MNDGDRARWAVGSGVQHEVFGSGEVVLDSDRTVVVRFKHGLEQVETSRLQRVQSAFEKAGSEDWDRAPEVVARILAEAIASVNARWGVFGWTKVQLLPHQLWVVRKVTASLPTRWLVADDVGLGKTIEAGMIIQSLVARRLVSRLLVLCPAGLVGQWQARLREMFDIRLVAYSTDADRPRAGFWEVVPFVVGSIQTLRKGSGGRRERLMAASPWDLVVVDEAHHLGVDDSGRTTLAYRLVRDLLDSRRVKSLLFFTGTPHRGKDRAFVALLELLRPDLFQSTRDLSWQLPSLKDVVIRNNKAAVTNLTGARLFRPLNVRAEIYTYTGEEAAFYQKLTGFIEAGLAYASTLDAMLGRAVNFVLIAMQKLASSSVAAIRRAMTRRRDLLLTAMKPDAKEPTTRWPGGEEDDWDRRAGDRAEEDTIDRSVGLSLMKGELQALEELIASADAVGPETKILRVLEMVVVRFAGRSVLFFTEYKATQACLVGELIRAFGRDAVAFINGDDRLDEVLLDDGVRDTLRMRREDAADRFNRGQARFLVSTEAGGEGIDLQVRCHTLIHVDLPWNPMRLHQRTGRIYRFGQKEEVDVVSLRNPETVEGRIWQLLEEKLERINHALTRAMDDPEDLSALVLGMTSEDEFDELFAEATRSKSDALEAIFARRTAELGSPARLDAVRDLLGSVSHFDFSELAGELPAVSLSDLQPFFELALSLEGRRVSHTAEGLSFKTPDAWLDDPAIRTDYSGLHFERGREEAGAARLLVGVGLGLFDRALRVNCERHAVIAAVPASLLPAAVVVFRIRDSVTESAMRRDFIVGTELSDNGDARVLSDWEVLKLLNELASRRILLAGAEKAIVSADSVRSSLTRAAEIVEKSSVYQEHDCLDPVLTLVAAVWPAA